MIAALVVLGLAALLIAIGSRLRSPAAPAESPLRRLVTGALAGFVLFHLLVTLLDLSGLGWSWPMLGLGLLLLCGIAVWLTSRAVRRESRLLSRWGRWGWGDGVALLVLGAFAALAWSLWITTPDFVFHWGIKGARFFLTSGVDYRYLARSWNWPINPNYPNLLPELYAATAELSGGFEPAPQMLWSVVFFALLLAGCKDSLRGTERPVEQAGIALIAVALGAFAVRNQMAGAADWMPALALVAAFPALLRPPDDSGDLQVGLAAAFAAASKVEGVTLAGFLLLAQLLSRAKVQRLSPQRLLRLATPAALVIVPWWIQTKRYHLYSPLSVDHPSWTRARDLVQALVDSLNGRAWHGFGWAILILPALAYRRTLRPFTCVVAGQLACFLWYYLASAFDTRYLVATSFPRLLLQVLPAIGVGAMTVASTPDGDGPAESEEAGEGGGSLRPRRAC